VPVADQQYILTVINGEERYTATEILTSAPELEDEVEQRDDAALSGDEVEVRYYFQDDGPQDNFYLSAVECPYIRFPTYEWSLMSIYKVTGHISHS